MNPADWAEADRRHLWHPFTPMGAWCAPGHEPLVLVGGKGATLRDSAGREYIDGNSSIWTNIHGHGHPTIDAALRAQLQRVAHTSFLGFTNPPAIELAQRTGASRRARSADAGFLFGRRFNRHRGGDQDGAAIFSANRKSRPARGLWPSSTATMATPWARRAWGESGDSPVHSASNFPVEHVASVEDLEALPAAGDALRRW